MDAKAQELCQPVLWVAPFFRAFFLCEAFGTEKLFQRSLFIGKVKLWLTYRVHFAAKPGVVTSLRAGGQLVNPSNRVRAAVWASQGCRLHIRAEILPCGDVIPFLVLIACPSLFRSVNLTHFVEAALARGWLGLAGWIRENH